MNPMATNASTAATGGSGSIDALRHLKELETEAEARLRAAVEQGERELSQLRSEIEASVHAARVEADRTREALLQAERARIEAEAERIVAAGRTAAEAIEHGAAKDLRAISEEILNRVVGQFRPPAGKGRE
ncbi:MAG: hypothetical protein ACREDK_00125 [Thermoplasmata archaeon]